MKFRIVVDTNVIISAYIHRKFSRIVFDFCANHHSVFVSQWLLEEVDSTLRDKFITPVEDRDIVRKLLNEQTTCIDITTPLPSLCSDLDDNNVLQLCDSASADILITGDSKLLELRVYGNCMIMSARIFYDTILFDIENK